MLGRISGFLTRHRSLRYDRLLEKLTPRQREVLRLIGEGKSTMQIARDLGISHKTVETHRAQMMDRISVYDVVGLVSCAIRVGVIKPESYSIKRV